MKVGHGPCALKRNRNGRSDQGHLHSFVTGVSRPLHRIFGPHEPVTATAPGAISVSDMDLVALAIVAVGTIVPCGLAALLWLVLRPARRDLGSFIPRGERDVTFRPLGVRTGMPPSSPSLPPCWVCGRPKDGHRHD